ncbi:hypothetical protein N39L_19940 [Limnospira platensis NIES-39]|jgi:hypothetical protein|uniref:DUF4382 domain-containing protein n=2 Tax=Sirenicapillariaceae TaxID=2934961 RepID=A0A5M3T8X1_LIMPL|nr:hypothetical protein NIES39_D05180 [Arthrospira platensis NIES-39]BDT12271.1 hypothetical protein N39L_19940 [Arthrospira platensis NIES-39]GCE94400.1 hypothetical protein NIES46_24550 [Arthrospira platensis NIES-46]
MWVFNLIRAGKMKKQLLKLGNILLLGAIALCACADTQNLQSQTSETPPSETTAIQPGSAEIGTIEFRANGEDFIREGFVSKDGWELSFNHVYVTIANAQAYETLIPYNPDTGVEPQAQQIISLVEFQTVDLAAGDESAATILVNEVPAPPGRYNAISWQMVPAVDGMAAGYSLMLVGTASKDGLTVPFNLRFNEEMAFSCGDYVGEERKGTLQPGGRADLEATFHFDHLFGDPEAEAEAEINTGALGFEPLAAIATPEGLDANLDTLREQLAAEDYQRIMAILPNLAHVGEGHCAEKPMSRKD